MLRKLVLYGPWLKDDLSIVVDVAEAQVGVEEKSFMQFLWQKHFILLVVPLTMYPSVPFQESKKCRFLSLKLPSSLLLFINKSPPPTFCLGECPSSDSRTKRSSL